MSRVDYPEFRPAALPRWALVRQQLDAGQLPDAAAATRAALEPVLGLVRPGTRACIAASSRGIDRMDEVVKAVVDRLREAGAEVFIVPAMGSHGGATAEGQLEVLAGYGITPETMGCEIRSSMETVALGEVEPGVPVFVDRNAFEGADLIVPVNRVKPHTGFSGPIESGLMKMLAIGLGKQKGADTFHRRGYDAFPRLIPAVGRHTIARAPVGFGVALVENGHARLAHVEAIPGHRIEAREAELLAGARAAMARLPLDDIDVLVVDLIGKDLSGTGLDPNVIGRGKAGSEAGGPRIGRIVIRGLTPATEGNASGIGFGDIVLRRAAVAVDERRTYLNAITSKDIEGARIPPVFDCDEDALGAALASCLRVDAPTARIVRVASTKHLELLWISEPALADAVATGRCEVIEPPRPIVFDAAGMFVDDLPAAVHGEA
ncbi:MAG TPA: lactate racemase domain-containing protein [Candidatus Limnocylindrales bacterium]|nr:lactate racemase domain-containing protein [Candidatus Limnocylindrales bacterium]